MSQITRSQYGGIARLVLRNFLLTGLPPKISIRLNYLINFHLRPLDPKLNELCMSLKHLSHPTILDIGGNIGLYSMALACANENANVHVYEPQPWNANYLKRAFRNMSRIKVHCYGLSDQTHSLVLNVPYLRWLGCLGRMDALASVTDIPDKRFITTRAIDIKLKSPNDCIFLSQQKNIDCIKIDVEGHELAVVRGLKDIILSHKPLLYIESLTPNSRLLYEYLQGLGYIQVLTPLHGSATHTSTRFPSSDELVIQEDSNYFFLPNSKVTE